MDAAPVIARGHSLAIFVPPVPAAAAPCLQAIPESRPTLVITADSDRAVALTDACTRPDVFAVSGLARAQRRLAAGLPALLVVAASDALQLLKHSQLRASEFRTVVLAWPEQLDEEGREALSAVMAETPRDSQRMVLTAVPGPDLDALLERYAFKAVTFGFPAADAPQPPCLGPASYVLARPSQLEAVRRRILDAVNPESDETVTIAPCPASREEAEARRGAPTDAAAAIRLIFVVEPVQLGWLRSLFSPLTPLRLPTSLAALEHRTEAVRARLVRTLESENLDRELFLIGPLLERFDAADVAAAALRLAGTETIAQTAEPAAGRPQPGGGAGSAPGAAIPSWTRLWVGVGKKDNVRPGDLLGAIVGETGLAADQIGKIEVRELFCLAEVRPEVAETVIRALNGTTLRGRHITARLDRGQGPHRSGPRRGGPPSRV